MDFVLDLPKLLCEIFFLHSRHYQKKLIPAIADQNISRPPDHSPDHTGNRRQRQIACIMPAGVIIKLKVIQIDHRNSSRQNLFAQLIFIIAAIVDAGKHIPVKLVLKPVQFCKQPFTSVDIDYIRFIQILDQLHNLRLSVYFNVMSRHLINIIFPKFQLRFFIFLFKCFQGNTVAAPLSGLPEIKTPARLCGNVLILSFCRIQDRFRIQQPHHRKHLFILQHPFLCLLPCHFIIFHSSVLFYTVRFVCGLPYSLNVKRNVSKTHSCTEHDHLRHHSFVAYLPVSGGLFISNIILLLLY